MVKVVVVVVDEGLENVCFYDDDVVNVFDWFFEVLFDFVYQFYFDFWLKKCYWKCRFINWQNFDWYVWVLKLGCEFCFVSDIDIYIDWILCYCCEYFVFEWIVEIVVDWKQFWVGWLGICYEVKVICEGCVGCYLMFLCFLVN